MYLPQTEYIQQQVDACNQQLEKLPEAFEKFKREKEREIALLQEEAGILSKVEQLKKDIENAQKKIQTKADQLLGRVSALQDIQKQYFYAPIVPGQEIMHGLDLRELDPDTRLLVQGGNADTIQALGGTLDIGELNVD